LRKRAPGDWRISVGPKSSSVPYGDGALAAPRDSSRHFDLDRASRAGSDRLKTLLLGEQVLCHPFVLGELACGTLRKRSEILSMLKALPEAHLPEHEEVLSFLEYRLGRCSSPRFHFAHRVHPVNLRQAAPESSGCLERFDVKFPREITRR
jgi:hypothetical protein